MTLDQLYKDIIKMLETAGIETPSLDARLIIEERARYDWSDIVTRPDQVIEVGAQQLIMEDVGQRCAGKPLSRIYGEREFWGLPFALSEDTLDPRPDTELIIDIALQHFANKEQPIRILDLGTGSGCILISLLSEFSDSVGFGIDLSAGAVKTAKSNAQQNSCGKRAHFICGSWMDAIVADNAQHKFDLIVSNPPYITNQVIAGLSPEVKNHDPILSLDGGVDGLQAYKYIFQHLKSYLSDDGIALFEIGYDQENDVMRLSEDAGFALRRVHADLAGNPRAVEISCGDK